jgi:6-phosphogluconolactonase
MERGAASYVPCLVTSRVTRRCGRPRPGARYTAGAPTPLPSAEALARNENFPGAQCDDGRRSDGYDHRMIETRIDGVSAKIMIRGTSIVGASRDSPCLSRLVCHGAVRSLVSLSLLALAGCSSPAGPDCLCGPFADNISGSLSGLVGSGLTLSTGNDYSGPTANGTNVLLGITDFNSSYNVTVQKQPTNPAQTCTVANGSGSAGESNVTGVSVTCTTNPARFAYVVNSRSDNISAFTVDAASGALTPIPGSPFPTGQNPVALAIDASNTFLYVANQTDATLSAFSIDRTSGVLTAVAGSPFATGSGPAAVAINPFNSVVYVSNSAANSVSIYSMTAGSGALTAAAGSPFATGGAPGATTVDPLGNVVFVANSGVATVSVFQVGSDTLTAATGSPVTVGLGPRALAVDTSDQYLYVANSESNTISVFSGAGAAELESVGGMPIQTGSTPSSIAVAPLDNFLYVANSGSSNISVFTVGAEGTLTATAGSPFSSEIQPSSVTLDPTGSFLYVTSAGSGTVTVYKVDGTDGVLTQITGSTVSVGMSPAAMLVTN